MNEREMAAGLAATSSYRYADRLGETLFVAGQVPLDSGGVMVGLGNAGVQAVQCLTNLDTIIEVHGFARGDIRRLTIYVAGDHGDLLETWDAVTGWFNRNVPPATLVGVMLLGHIDQMVEIDAAIAADPTS